MVDKHQIVEIVEGFLAGSDKFLVGISVSARNRVHLSIDGDQGVTIADCAALSRHIESHLDRDKDDFDLEVSSAGVGSPLLLKRQYQNNKGRLISIQFPDESKLRGKLLDVNDDGITVEKEVMKKGKRKKNPDTDQDDTAFVAFEQIREAKILPMY